MVGGFKQFFSFSPQNLGKIPILTNIFQMGWNHQLDLDGFWWFCQEELDGFSISFPYVVMDKLLLCTIGFRCGGFLFKISVYL